MDKPLIVAKFTGNKILGEKGRILFTLLNAYSQAGYSIQLASNLKRDAAGEIGSQIFAFTNLSVIENPPDNTSDKILLYDEPDQKDLSKKWLRTVRVRFDIFSSFRGAKQSILFPFPVHPVHVIRNFQTKLSKLRENEKRVKLFFSGDMKGYTKNHIRYPRPKLPRLEIVDVIRKELPEKTIFLKDSDSIASFFTLPYSNKCAIIDTDKTWIDDNYWLDYLSKADFFLAPPGIVMPMCHNIIEAMAVGAIPVTNYPEWFQPDLKHMENCIEFSDRQDLIEKINLVLTMDKEQIKMLRQNTVSYYEEYLTRDRFIQAFEAVDSHSIDILMMTEQYVKDNATKLNRNSFIISGTSKQSSFTWHKLLHMFG